MLERSLSCATTQRSRRYQHGYSRTRTRCTRPTPGTSRRSHRSPSIAHSDPYPTTKRSPCAPVELFLLQARENSELRSCLSLYQQTAGSIYRQKPSR
ncbi:hypothetical protein AYI70_g1374 [Smittium culicis]|uniref:Uncharacterized protein n=1 Tax=Smittium culicis TaxID=133412 RepID=A0A1R1YCW9_9FUNG|nr:hypothetical protein AYI70_g1374 [Smittium culicis]